MKTKKDVAEDGSDGVSAQLHHPAERRALDTGLLQAEMLMWFHRTSGRGCGEAFADRPMEYRGELSATKLELKEFGVEPGGSLRVAGMRILA